MKITIGHLFHDLLNLYGENGNVLALEKALVSQGVEVEIKNLSIDNEPWDLDNLDVVYIGAGTEQNQLLALNTLMKYKEEINQMILDNKYFICTGNSIELFGKHIQENDNVIETLNSFDYITERTPKRIVSECVFSCDETQSKILGFENHQGEIKGITNPLFTVEKGYGSNINTQAEGFRKNNFYGTYLIGPLLVRNPELLKKICKDIILNNDINFTFKDFNLSLEQTAHDKFIEKYNKD